MRLSLIVLTGRALDNDLFHLALTFFLFSYMVDQLTQGVEVSCNIINITPPLSFY